jgi:hypothetical protein
MMDSERQEAEVPVLTQIVEVEAPSRTPALDAAALEALARQLERAVLERLGPEIERAISQAVREALAASLAQATAAAPKRD